MALGPLLPRLLVASAKPKKISLLEDIVFHFYEGTSFADIKSVRSNVEVLIRNRILAVNRTPVFYFDSEIASQPVAVATE